MYCQNKRVNLRIRVAKLAIDVLDKPEQSEKIKNIYFLSKKLDKPHYFKKYSTLLIHSMDRLDHFL